MADITVSEVTRADNLGDEFVSMELTARLEHDKEQNPNPEQPNRHAVIVGENAIIFETE